MIICLQNPLPLLLWPTHNLPVTQPLALTAPPAVQLILEPVDCVSQCLVLLLLFLPFALPLLCCQFHIHTHLVLDGLCSGETERWESGSSLFWILTPHSWGWFHRRAARCFPASELKSVPCLYGVRHQTYGSFIFMTLDHSLLCLLSFNIKT